jgi:DNA-binding transcriptional MerR regulator
VDTHKERLTVPDAAKLLGVTPEAIRQRIRRGTIEYEQDEGGRYHVYLDPSEDVQNNVHNGTQDVPNNVHKGTQDPSEDLRDYVETLKRELEIRNEELKRKDTIIMSLTQRIPEIESPREAPETPVTATEDTGNGDTPPDTERRSWWQRFFFGSSS